MIKLIKLELRKNNLKSYLIGDLGIFLAVIVLGVVFCAIPILEPNDPSSKMFSDPNTIVTMASIMSMSAFSIMTAIMYSKFVVEEYTGRKNVVLFTYPQKRSSILIAKFVLIFFFIFVSLFTVNTIGITIVGFMSNIIGLISEPFANFNLLLKYSIMFSLVSNFIELIALKIGFYKKSIIVPVVVSTVLTSPFSNMVMLFKDKSIVAFAVAGTVLLFISMFLFIGLLNKVNKMECVS